MSGAVGFVNEVAAEARRATWPTRQELFSSTVVVIVTLVLLGMFVGVCDKILVLLLKALTGAG